MLHQLPIKKQAFIRSKRQPGTEERGFLAFKVFAYLIKNQVSGGKLLKGC